MIRIALATLPAVFMLAFAPAAAAQAPAPASPPAWTRGATCYEIFVRSFADSDGDGVGDFNGLTAKLDYINDGDPGSVRDLGAQCIWLMPINPSPSYHGYDVTNYYGINPEFGTMEDFKRFVREAHRRGIKVVMDMVLNHSSNEHHWFQAAALYPDSKWRDWYLWLPKDPQVKNHWGGNNWHKSPFDSTYYYGFFWGGMPDLNVENPEVVEETKRIATFWLQEVGVDGFRLDAIRHLVEADTGRITTNQPGTHAYLREYAAHVRRVKPDAYTIGEVWDTLDAMLAYYPDQLDSHFAFDVANRIVESVQKGDAHAMLDPVLALQRAVPNHRWSPFLRNHDQTRTMTEFRGDMDKAKVAATIVLTMPGMPFIYYGEEIGMTGDKPDPRLRTPMHWRRGPAAGFTTGLPWIPLQPDSMTANVEVMDDDPASLLNLHRRLIHLRAAHSALGAGDLIPLTTTHAAVAAYLRRDGDRAALIVANLGDTALDNVRVSSGRGALPRGAHQLRDLLASRDAGRLQVNRDGRLRNQSLGTLPAKTAVVYDVVVAGR